MVKRKTQVVLDSSDSSNSESENSDLDSELLSLAKKKKSKVRSDRSSSSSQESDSDHDDSKKEKVTKRKKPEKNITRRNSELEEGEVTDSELSDFSQEEFNDGYGSDLMGDDEDRARLGQMTEKEREQEIFKRIEAREVMKTRFNIEKKLKQAKKREMKKQKFLPGEKKSEPTLDLKERILERKKNIEENRGKKDNKFHAMNLLKEKREQKREREEKEKMQKAEQEKGKEEPAANESGDESVVSHGYKTKLKASDVYSDDSGSDSEKETITKPKKKIASSSSSSSSSDSESEVKAKSARTQYVTTREQLNKIKLSRHKLERFVHLPFFKKTAVGCFVRIMIGQNNGRPVYRVCEVMDVCETGKIYQLGNTRTNKGLRLRHGMQERVFRLEFASNQEFSENEFNKWRETCALQGISMPSVEDWEHKQRDIKEALSYEFREEDVEKIVKEKERFKTAPFNYAMKKTQLMKERDSAQASGDTDRATDLQNQLNQLEERAIELDRLRTSSISSISYINDRNRKKNVEEAEKAIMAELRATKGQRADDPFTRRHTKPSMMLKKKVDGEPMNKASNNVPPAVVPIPKEEVIKNNTHAKKENPQKQSEDMYAAHDFDIKLDFDVPSQTTSSSTVTSPIVEKPTKDIGPPKRSLNLEDYKKRKGFI